MKTSKCTKVRYSTQDKAIDAAFAARRSGTLRLDAYRCDTCRSDSGKRYWHIGHSAPRYKRAGMGRRP